MCNALWDVSTWCPLAGNFQFFLSTLWERTLNCCRHRCNRFVKLATWIRCIHGITLVVRKVFAWTRNCVLDQSCPLNHSKRLQARSYRWCKFVNFFLGVVSKSEWRLCDALLIGTVFTVVISPGAWILCDLSSKSWYVIPLCPIFSFVKFSRSYLLACIIDAAERRLPIFALTLSSLLPELVNTVCTWGVQVPCYRWDQIKVRLCWGYKLSFFLHTSLSYYHVIVECMYNQRLELLFALRPRWRPGLSVIAHVTAAFAIRFVFSELCIVVVCVSDAWSVAYLCFQRQDRVLSSITMSVFCGPIVCLDSHVCKILQTMCNHRYPALLSALGLQYSALTGTSTHRWDVLQVSFQSCTHDCALFCRSFSSTEGTYIYYTRKSAFFLLTTWWVFSLFFADDS